MWLRGASALALLGLLGCADTEKAHYQYDVDLRWTSYGIPHVKANDWGALGMALPTPPLQMRYV